MTLLPFATFSLFHVLTFLRTNILPKFSPPSVPAAAGGAAGAAKAQTATDKLGRAVQLWVKGASSLARDGGTTALQDRRRLLTIHCSCARQPGNYDPAMKFVAYAELLIFARVVLGAVTYVPIPPGIHAAEALS